MNGKIDVRGWLKIQREGGRYLDQYCPFANNINIQANCGEWCPLFGEIEINNNLLPICGGKELIFDEFSRESGGDE